MNTRISLLLGILLASFGCGSKEVELPPSKEEKPAAQTADGAPSTTSSGSYLGAIAAAQKSAQGNVGMASIQQAIQLFRVEEERNPANLEELVQKGYLPQLPKAPYNRQYVYDARTGGIRVTPK